MASIISGLLSIATRLFGSSAFMSTIKFALNRWFIGSAVATYSGLLLLESYGVLPSGLANILKGVPFQQQLIVAVLGILLSLITHLPIFKSKITKMKQELEYKKLKVECLKLDVEIQQHEEKLNLNKNK